MPVNEWKVFTGKVFLVDGFGKEVPMKFAPVKLIGTQDTGITTAPLDEDGNPMKKKKPKVKKNYEVGDRIEAVREFGNTGIKEGHQGTIVKIYSTNETSRPLIVQWDNHAVSHAKEWNYPFKDVRPISWEPGEATDDSLF